MMSPKKTVCNKLVAKINKIDTSGFLLKNKYDRDKTEVENEIPNTNELAKRLCYNVKITGIENKIPSFNRLASNSALTTVESCIKFWSCILNFCINCEKTVKNNKK